MKLLIIPGSLRKESYNKQLAKVAESFAHEVGFKTTYYDLIEHPFPLFNQDDSDAFHFPDAVLKAKKLLQEHAAILFVTPEHNASIPAALKNFIDWTSRAVSKEDSSCSCYTGKVAALMGASPSTYGALRAILHLRSILSIMGVFVIPQEKTIMQAHEAFKVPKLSDQHQQGIKKNLIALHRVAQSLSS
jgi:NAD(P)H-dependent FMN reductase